MLLYLHFIPGRHRTMKDCYGRTFNPDSIQNKDAIGFLEAKPLEEWSETDIACNLVLIKDNNNVERLYVLSDLKQMLKANYYCRLEDPYTREDILVQVPAFNAAIEFQAQAANYNAHILDQNPHFIPLLTTYVKEMLHVEDEARYRDAKKEDIRANKSKELDEFYTSIANFSEEEKKQFLSLFITNRRPYNQRDIWILPANWEVTGYSFTQERQAYTYFVKHNHYKTYPHRNVLLADLITDPEDACMHSWGMDVLYLLQEYHIGKNLTFHVFDQDTAFAQGMEQELSKRIHARLTPGTLDPDKGQDAWVKATQVMNNKQIVQLKKTCTDYMDYLLSQSGKQKEGVYPSPLELENLENPLNKKYAAVYDMYLTLQNNIDGDNDDECLDKFAELYNDQGRQEAIAMHRDNAGIRFLNIVASVLSLGIKNLASYCETGYWSFWNSRGAAFKEDIYSIMQNSMR